MTDKEKESSSYHIAGNKIVFVDKMSGTIKIANEIPISVAIDYLTHLKEEIQANLDLMQGKSIGDPTRSTTAFFTYKTSIWDTLKPSGLLPYLLEAGLLKKVTDFYFSLQLVQEHLADIKAYSQATDRGNDRFSAFVTASLLTKRINEDLTERVLPELRSAYDQGQILSESIEQVIDSLKEKPE